MAITRAAYDCSVDESNIDEAAKTWSQHKRDVAHSMLISVIRDEGMIDSFDSPCDGCMTVGGGSAIVRLPSGTLENVYLSLRQLSGARFVSIARGPGLAHIELSNGEVAQIRQAP